MAIVSPHPMRPLGDVLTPVQDEVTVVPEHVYQPIGVYGFGRGLFRRSALRGSETSYKQLIRLHRDQLVLSRLKAFEGAVAVVDGAHDGGFVSKEFPTFEIRSDLADAAYIGWLCRWPRFWERLRGLSRGVGARRERLHEADLLTVGVPVPKLDEQRRIAKRLGAFFARLERVERSLGGHDRVTTLLPQLIEQIVSKYPTELTRLGDLLSVVSDLVRPGDEPAPAKSFVGLQHIESHTGRRIGESPLGGEQGRKFRFRPGDIVFGYLRPYLNKVWVADRWGLCSVDQYVLRPRDGRLAQLIAYLLRGEQVLARAIELTHSLQLPRLRSGLLLDLTLRLPRDDVAVDLLRELDGASERVTRLDALHRSRQPLLAAVGPAMLNESFAGAR